MFYSSTGSGHWQCGKSWNSVMLFSRSNCWSWKVIENDSLVWYNHRYTCQDKNIIVIEQLASLKYLITRIVENF